MSNVFNLVSEEAYVEQTDKIAQFLAIIAAHGDRGFKPTSWEGVQSLVRAGLASRVFSIGDQLTCQRHGVNLVWDIIGIDHDTPADSQYTHSMTLQLHDCFPTNMQFDAPEAFYYATSSLAAGTYNFTFSGTSYQFTLANTVPAGGQLILTFSNNVPSSISVAQTKGGAVTESSIAVTTGSGGTALDSNYINDFGKAQNGSNSYKESAIRQWLNSNAAAGSVWTPQNDFDRPPTISGDLAGFLNGMDADFLAVLGNVTKVTAVPDSNTPDTTTDTFFLLSRSEAYGGIEVSGVNEGAAYLYYADYSDLTTAGMNNDSNRIKYRNGSAQHWWIRTQGSRSGYAVRIIHTTGMVHYYIPSGNHGVAPACCII